MQGPDKIDTDKPIPARRGPPPGGWPKRAAQDGAAAIAQETALPVSAGVTADADLSAEGAVADGRATLIADIARIRSIRRPFGAFTQKLALPTRPGYHRHWFNDVAGRVDEASSSGWTHVKGNDGKPIRRVVGSGRDNGALYAFAMEIPSVFWEEDMVERHKAAQGKIEEIKRAPIRARPGESKASDRNAFYSPVENTEILQVVKR